MVSSEWTNHGIDIEQAGAFDFHSARFSVLILPIESIDSRFTINDSLPGQRPGRGSVNALRLLLGDELSVRRKHRVELETSEKRVIADIEAYESAELDDLFLRIVPPKLIVKLAADPVRVQRHQLAVAQRELFRLGKPGALLVMSDPLVDVVLLEALPLRRSGPDISSIHAGGHTGKLYPDDFLQPMVDSAGIENGIPRNEHCFAQIDVVTHHRVKSRIGRAMLQALVYIRPELGVPQRLDVEHGDVGHGDDDISELT